MTQGSSCLATAGLRAGIPLGFSNGTQRRQDAKGAGKTGKLLCVSAPWRLGVKIDRGLGVSEKIPKGFRPSAQRCHDEGGATLGGESEIEINPNGVAARTRRSRSQPRWG